MDNFTFGRRAVRTSLNSFIKGWYHDNRESLVEEQCFGNWMDESYKNMYTTGSKLMHGDIWGVHHSELKQATDDLWDMFFRNLDHCGVYRFLFNNYDWCMNNIEECRWHDGLVQRIEDNVFDIIS